MSRFEYQYTEGQHAGQQDIPIRVRLDSRYVGDIRPVLNGWRYFPKGQKDGGETFQSVLECQRSLQEEVAG